jgi:predicted alpha/beta-hydrolase family hydrolase
LYCHTLAHYALKAGHTDAHLVLKQFANAAKAPVAKVVYIVYPAYAMGKPQQIAY